MFSIYLREFLSISLRLLIILLKRGLLAIAVLSPIVIVWEGLVWLGPLSRLAPSSIDTFTWSVEHLDRLWFHTIITFQETIAGFGVALLLALTCGIIIDVLPYFKNATVAFLAASNGIPKIVFAPIFFLWLGYGLAPKIAMAALIAFFPVMIGFLHGLELVDPSMQIFLNSTGASWSKTFFRVRFPWALRSMIAGCKIAIGLALVGSLVSEFINASSGLGYLIKLGEDDFELEMRFAGIVAASAIGLLLYLLIDFLDVAFLYRFPPLKQEEEPRGAQF